VLAQALNKINRWLSEKEFVYLGMSFYLGDHIKMDRPKPTSFWTRLRTKLTQWWKKNIINEVPEHLKDLFWSVDWAYA
jgi:hypothetical protein